MPPPSRDHVSRLSPQRPGNEKPSSHAKAFFIRAKRRAPAGRSHLFEKPHGSQWTEEKGESVKFCSVPETQSADDRLKGALLVAATIVAAVRLRGEPITNTPKVIATVHDAVKLSRMVLRALNSS